MFVPEIESTFALTRFPTLEQAQEELDILSDMTKLSQYIFGLTKNLPASFESMSPVIAFLKAMLKPEKMQKNYMVTIDQNGITQDWDKTWRASVRICIAFCPYQVGEKMKINTSGLLKPHKKIRTGIFIGPYNEPDFLLIRTSAGDFGYHMSRISRA